MNNPPAFPQHPVFDSREHVEYGGMTLRDYFAAAALSGMLANPLSEIATGSPEDFAKWAFERADAMLKAREEK